MGNIIGEGFSNYVRKQINERQKVHGSGVDETRTPQEISYLNSRSGWIKIASSVSIENTKNGKLRLKKLGLENEFGTGEELAKHFVLFNGISSLSNRIYEERKGIWSPNSNQSGDINNRFKNDALYGGIGSQDFGLAPTPGILGMEVQSINMGSLRSATIRLKAYNRDQLDIIDLLYLRLGFTLLVEWGHSSYIDNDENIISTKTSVIDGSFFKNDLIGKTYFELLPILEKKRFISGGNYDAFFGRVTNFSWDFQPDGSYNIQLQLYSIGDVIESLKLNVTPPNFNIEKYKRERKENNSEQSEDYLNDSVARYRYENKVAGYFYAIRAWDKLKIGDFLNLTNQFQKDKLIEDTQTNFIEQNSDTVNTTQLQNIQKVELQIEEEKKWEEMVKNFKLSKSGSPLLSNGVIETIEKEYQVVYPEVDPTGGGIKDIPLTVKLFFYSDSDTGTSNLNENYIGNILRKKYGNTTVSTSGLIFYNVKKSTLTEKGGSKSDLSTEYVVDNQFPEDYNSNDYTTRYFKPNFPILNNGAYIKAGSEFNNNFPPFPNPQDFQIALSNETRIEEAYQKYLEDKEKANQSVIQNQEATPTQKTKSPQVHYILEDKKSKNKNRVEYGRVINFKEGWVDTKLYDSQTLIADHYATNVLPESLQYYIRFGTFLGFLRDQLLYKIKSRNPFNPPIVDVDTDIESNVMYTLPNHVSLDPRVCITNIKMHSFNTNTQTYDGLEEFQNNSPFYGKIMNIYLNQQFIMDVMLENMDLKGNIYFYNVISSICAGVNRSLGGINNLRPVIDESLNCVKIVDETTIPNIDQIVNYLITKFPGKYTIKDLKGRYQYTKNTLANGDIPYQLELFGYSKNLPKKDEVEVTTSNFVHNLSLRTQVTKELVTMLTIGATSQGSVVGEELTSISKWNYGMFDRYNPELIEGDGTEVSSSLLSQEFALTKLKYTEFLINEFEPPTSTPFLRYYPTNANSNVEYKQYNPSVIENNITYGTNFFKYLVTSASIASGEETLPSAGTTGFLPIEMDVELDGLSGVKIYQKIETNTKFLPNNYPDNLSFVTIGISHKLVDNNWTTQLKGISQPIVNEQINVDQLFKSLDENLKELENQVLIQQDCEDTPVGKEVRESKVAWVEGKNSQVKNSTKSNNIKILIREMEAQGITSPYAQIGILAVVGKESGWEPVNEMSYSGTGNKRLRSKFGGRLSMYSEQELTDLKKDDIKFYDAIYGPAAMKFFKGWDPDNKNPGDGYKYRGRGFNQLTFKASYRRWGKIAGIDGLVENPDLLNKVENAAKISIAFLKRGMKKVSKREYQTDDINSIQDIATGIYIATKANAGGKKQIKGTETYADAKEAGCNFWVTNVNTPIVLPGDTKPMIFDKKYEGLQGQKLYQMQTQNPNLFQQSPTSSVNLQLIEPESDQDIYNRLQSEIGPI